MYILVRVADRDSSNVAASDLKFVIPGRSWQIGFMTGPINIHMNRECGRHSYALVGISDEFVFGD